MLLEALPQILPLEDEDIAKAAAREIGKQNVKIVTGANIEGVDGEGRGRDDRPSAARREEFDYLVIAAGRGPDVEGLGLDRGRRRRSTSAGWSRSTARSSTSLDGVYAIGDIVPGPGARAQGLRRGRDRGRGRRRARDPHPLDHAVDPRRDVLLPAGRELRPDRGSRPRTQGYDVVVGKVPMGAVGAPTVYGDRGGMIKIVGDKKYGEILGGHIVCAKAADLIEELVVAQRPRGRLPRGRPHRSTPHPAFAEAVMEAARAADGWLIHG